MVLKSKIIELIRGCDGASCHIIKRYLMELRDRNRGTGMGGLWSRENKSQLNKKCMRFLLASSSGM